MEGAAVRFQKVGVLLVGVAAATLAAFTGLFVAYLAQLGCDGSDTSALRAAPCALGGTEDVWIYSGWGTAIVAPLICMAWSLAPGGGVLSGSAASSEGWRGASCSC